MERAAAGIPRLSAQGSALRKRAFFAMMSGFLFVPFLPLQFTSIVTAVVWIFSGTGYAMVFVVLGTFMRADSFTIFSGIQNIFNTFLPVRFDALSQVFSVATMFVGNVATAYLFQRLLKNRLSRRLTVLAHLATT